jgi:hypothetical protein
MRCRNERDNPESFLTVAGAILAVLVILIAVAVAIAVAGVVVRNLAPTLPGITMPDRLGARSGTLASLMVFPNPMLEAGAG